jgi:thiamine-phosphate pyrophosphorylase
LKPFTLAGTGCNQNEKKMPGCPIYFRVKSTVITMKPLSECRLYTFVDSAYLNGRAPDDIAKRLCEGGADLIQLRAKQSAPEEISHLAQCILPISRKAGVGLIINDHLEIARDIGAEFCHLGQEDFFDSGHRHVSELGVPNSHCRIGISTHSAEQARRAVVAGADYVAVGPVYATGTKPSAKPVTLEYVRWAKANLTLPWFAIGGINLTNLDDVLNAGAQRICVVSAILNSNDIAASCREFKKRLSLR